MNITRLHLRATFLGETSDEWHLWKTLNTCFYLYFYFLYVIVIATYRSTQPCIPQSINFVDGNVRSRLRQRKKTLTNL